MNALVRARSAAGIAALLLSGLLAGCNDQASTATLAASVPSPTNSPVGSAAAKGAELSAVVTVRAWIYARNRAVRTGDSSGVDDLTGRGCGACGDYLSGDRWSVRSARVVRHTIQAASVAVDISGATRPRRRVALEFEVSRVAGKSVITRIAPIP